MPQKLKCWCWKERLIFFVFTSHSSVLDACEALPAFWSPPAADEPDSDDRDRRNNGWPEAPCSVFPSNVCWWWSPVWKDWVQKRMLGPWSSQKWHKDITAFMVEWCQRTKKFSGELLVVTFNKIVTDPGQRVLVMQKLSQRILWNCNTLGWLTGVGSFLTQIQHIK